jgi:hypothetical protein
MGSVDDLPSVVVGTTLLSSPRNAAGQFASIRQLHAALGRSRELVEDEGTDPA